jgi:hypothetical protein
MILSPYKYLLNILARRFVFNYSIKVKCGYRKQS